MRRSFANVIDQVLGFFPEDAEKDSPIARLARELENLRTSAAYTAPECLGPLWRRAHFSLLPVLEAADKGSKGWELYVAEAWRGGPVPGERAPLALVDVARERKRQDDQWGTVQERAMFGRLGVERLPDLLRAVLAVGDDAEAEGLNARACMESHARELCESLPADRVTWAHTLVEELFEAVNARTLDEMRAELVQVAALVVFAVESIDAAEDAKAPPVVGMEVPGDG